MVTPWINFQHYFYVYSAKWTILGNSKSLQLSTALPYFPYSRRKQKFTPATTADWYNVKQLRYWTEAAITIHDHNTTIIRVSNILTSPGTISLSFTSCDLETEAVRWYSTNSFKLLNLTTQRKNFPWASRSTLKCCTPSEHLKKTKTTTNCNE